MISLSSFLHDTAPTEIHTLSLHDALPISQQVAADPGDERGDPHHGRYRGDDGVGDGRATPEHREAVGLGEHERQDRKSTRLNSSHANISYAVFCLKKKI